MRPVAGASQTGGRASRRESAGVAAWLLGACLLLLFPLFQWARTPRGERLIVPQTPMDKTNPRFAEEWRFLWATGEWVPRGTTYTVLASDPHREMSLYMISLGLFPERRPIPLSYHGFPLADPPKESAEYLLLFLCQRRPPAGYRLVKSFDSGCVYRREGAR